MELQLDIFCWKTNINIFFQDEWQNCKLTNGHLKIVVEYAVQSIVSFGGNGSCSYLQTIADLYLYVQENVFPIHFNLDTPFAQTVPSDQSEGVHSYYHPGFTCLQTDWYNFDKYIIQ